MFVGATIIPKIRVSYILVQTYVFPSFWKYVFKTFQKPSKVDGILPGIADRVALNTEHCIALVSIKAKFHQRTFTTINP